MQRLPEEALNNPLTACMGSGLQGGNLLAMASATKNELMGPLDESTLNLSFRDGLTPTLYM